MSGYIAFMSGTEVLMYGSSRFALPASSTRTEIDGSSVRREARTRPAVCEWHVQVVSNSESMGAKARTPPPTIL